MIKLNSQCLSLIALMQGPSWHVLDSATEAKVDKYFYDPWGRTCVIYIKTDLTNLGDVLERKCRNPPSCHIIDAGVRHLPSLYVMPIIVWSTLMCTIFGSWYVLNGSIKLYSQISDDVHKIHRWALFSVICYLLFWLSIEGEIENHKWWGILLTFG